jgi:hypothetical protein
MELWRGITGFRGMDDPPLPVTDFKKFSEHCHTAARSLGGTVRMLQEPGSKVCSNFAQAILETTSGTIAVLLNAHFPIVAFATPSKEGEMKFRFVEAPPLATGRRARRSLGEPRSETVGPMSVRASAASLTRRVSEGRAESPRLRVGLVQQDSARRYSESHARSWCIGQEGVVANAPCVLKNTISGPE